jgi:hypothetical protein
VNAINLRFFRKGWERKSYTDGGVAAFVLSFSFLVVENKKDLKGGKIDEFLN